MEIAKKEENNTTNPVNTPPPFFPLREAEKNPPLMARPLRRGGGGGKGRAIIEKRTFFETFFRVLNVFKASEIAAQDGKHVGGPGGESLACRRISGLEEEEDPWPGGGGS